MITIDLPSDLGVIERSLMICFEIDVSGSTKMQ